MSSEIEEPFRFNFQADLLHSGSISFGRFESESLSWEKRSSFSHNRYLEEVEKYSKPGSVTEKKAYFEAHFRRKALLKQNSSESQDGREFPTSENDDLNDIQESEHDTDSKHFTCFDEGPRSSGHSNYDKEEEIQICVDQNVETICAENINLGIVDHTITEPDHLKLEETAQFETTNVGSVKSKETAEVALNDTVVMVDVTSEMKQTKPKPKAHANFPQASRIISSESSNVSTKTKVREMKGSTIKEKVNKSPRPASYIAHPGRKTSKSEESSKSIPKVKLPSPIKSVAKEYRSEKVLPGTSQTTNRTKQTIPTPGKPHVNQIAAGLSFKSGQRAERRKEEKRAAAERTQYRKSLDFKATPMPSFYKESARSSDQNKVISTSKTPNRPRTASMAPSNKKVLSTSANSSNPRPSSSTNKNRLPETSRRVQEKKKDLNLPKQKERGAIIGPQVRETKGVHTGTRLKQGYLAVGVAT